MNDIRAIHGNSEEYIQKVESGSVDIICIDPPYLYLKNQRLERTFDERAFFAECKRILTKKGFIITFGRGESFYRWNTILAELGLKFKEEIIWDKRYSSSPLMNLSRVHETISIFANGNNSINKVRVPYIEIKGFDIEGIVSDVKRLCAVFNNPQSLLAVKNFFESNVLYIAKKSYSNNVSISSDINSQDRCVAIVRGIGEGMKEKSIIRMDRTQCNNFTKFGVSTDNRQCGDRCANVAQSIECGMNEKSIIRQPRDHYTAIHPTQKPVRLLERLIGLCIPKDEKRVLVADFFAGSFSCAEACYNLGLDFFGVEIDAEYYKAGLARIERLKTNPDYYKNQK